MMKRKKLPFTLMLAALSSFAVGQAFADQRTWTLDADFDEGTLVNLNHDPKHDQIQLNDSSVAPFPFIRVACSDRGTSVLADTRDGRILGEYKTAPEGRGTSPSRTTVDFYGNWWTANRSEAENDSGSAVKMGVAFGGTRCNADGTPNPNGEYLKDIGYNTCVDRNGDGLIRTSRGLGDILPWPDLGDGQGGAGGGDARVQDAVDECILIYQRLPGAPNTRHVSVDKENNVWVAGHPYEPRIFYKLDGSTGAIMEHFDAQPIGCGGYGGLISDDGLGNEILWSSGTSVDGNSLLRYDLSARTGQCLDIENSYGLAADRDGYIWNSRWSSERVTKIDPATGAELSGFPVDADGYVRGVAVTYADNNVWVARSGKESVIRFDSNGHRVAIIPVGDEPTGVAVDAAGKVWVTNYKSHNMMRINPANNAVDLTVDLGAGAGPYNYSDMTGIVRLSRPPVGFWRVVYDGGCNALWDRISWNSDENPATNSAIKVEVRAAGSKAGLAAEPFQTVANGADLTGMKGQFIEVRTTLTTEAPIGQRGLPVLKDLTLEHHPLTMTVNIPDQKYNFGFPPFDLDDFIFFNPAGNWFNDVLWSHSPVPDGWNVSIDDNHVVTVTGPPNETNGPPSETKDVPITFSANLSWGGEQCGDSDEAVFIANHPPVLCDAAAFQCLWSPNHKAYTPVPLTGFVCDPDGDAVTARILSITSDEPTKKNNGDPAPDADPNCIGTDTAQLRPERDGKGDGRVYMVTFVASDGRGGETTMQLPVRVPHNQNGCDAVDSGQKYDATIDPEQASAKGKGKGKKK